MEGSKNSLTGWKLYLVGNCPPDLSVFSQGVVTCINDKDGYYLCAPEIDCSQLSLNQSIHFRQCISLQESKTDRSHFMHMPGFTSEETKHRLLSLLRQQRQLFLSDFLANTNVDNQTAEALHLSHAFACATNLSPSAHNELLLQTSKPQTSSNDWVNEKNRIALFSHLAWLCITAKEPSAVRELVRTATAPLPFGTRNELRTLVENCFIFIQGGHSHVG